MRRLAWILGGAALLGAFGCDTDIDKGERPAYWNGVNSVTLFLYDGLTGAAVTTAEVTLQVGPTGVTAKGHDNIYTAAQLPAGNFPLLISAEGYLDFVGQLNLTGTGTLINGTVPNTNPTFTFVTATAILYPVQNVEEDVVLTVYDGDSGAVVQSGQVVATLDPAATIQAVVGDVLSPLDGQVGLKPTTVVGTLSNGRIVLPRGSLVLGAVYKIDIFSARDSEGRYLQPIQDVTFRAGVDFPEIVLFMGPPAQCPVALSANNEDGGTQASLIVTFPYAIEACHEADDLGWTNITNDGVGADARDTDDDAVVATPDDAAPVSVALSENDTVLTVTANLESSPDSNDADDSLSLTFSGVKVRVKGSLVCLPLGSIGLRKLAGAAPTCTTTATPISNTITVRAQ